MHHKGQSPCRLYVLEDQDIVLCSYCGVPSENNPDVVIRLRLRAMNCGSAVVCAGIFQSLSLDLLPSTCTLL